MMKMRTLKQVALAWVATGFLATAAAEDLFSALDANSDGNISSEEATANETLYKGWDIADANQDGSVDAAEFSAFEARSIIPK
jgi:Ca2+-binding EF-hand superfamily protein